MKCKHIWRQVDEACMSTQFAFRCEAVCSAIFTMYFDAGRCAGVVVEDRGRPAVSILEVMDFVDLLVREARARCAPARPGRRRKSKKRVRRGEVVTENYYMR